MNEKDIKIELLPEKDFVAAFVYEKQGEYKVLYYQQAAKHDADLKKQGWKLEKTIEPVEFIQDVLNNFELTPKEL